MDGLKNYLTYKKFPRAMQKRVRKTCAHYYGKKTINRPDWDKARAAPPARPPPSPLAPPTPSDALPSPSLARCCRWRCVWR